MPENIMPNRVYPMKVSNTAIMCLSIGKGGMEIDAIKTANLLKDETNIYLICKSGSYIAEYLGKNPVNGINVVEVKFNSKLAIGFIDFRLMWNLRKLINKYKIENLIFFGVSEIKTIFFSLAGKKTKLIVRHGTKKSKSRHDFIRRILFSRVNVHIAISDYISSNVKEIFPVSKNSQVITIFPSLGIPMDYIPEQTADQVVKILHTGRLVTAKGYEDALDACDYLYKNKINFVFTAVGDMPDASYIKKLSKKLNTKEYSRQVRFTGHVEDITKYLENSDVLLFPSKGEGFCNSFNEALAYGLICLAYENTVFPELRKIGFYFHMAKNGDIPSLAEKLLFICNNLKTEKDKCFSNINLAKKLYTKKVEKDAYLKILA